MSETHEDRRDRLAESYRAIALDEAEQMTATRAAMVLGLQSADEYEYPKHYGLLIGKLCYAYADGMIEASKGGDA